MARQSGKDSKLMTSVEKITDQTGNLTRIVEVENLVCLREMGVFDGFSFILRLGLQEERTLAREQRCYVLNILYNILI